MMCKCGSYAINDDPKGALCDKCFRDVKISALKAQRDELLAAAKEVQALYIDSVFGFGGHSEEAMKILSAAIANAEKDNP